MSNMLSSTTTPLHLVSPRPAFAFHEFAFKHTSSNVTGRFFRTSNPSNCKYYEHGRRHIQLLYHTIYYQSTIIAIMPFSKAQRRQIFSKLSSIVEHSFLDDADSVVGVIPSPKPKPTHQIKRPTAAKVTSRRRHIQSFIVVYTMIFFNGCKSQSGMMLLCRVMHMCTLSSSTIHDQFFS